jgi:protease I
MLLLKNPHDAGDELAIAPVTDVTRPAGTKRRRKPGAQPLPEHPLDGLTVAILATDGVELSELQEPKRALEVAGARTHVISPKEGRIRSWSSKDWGDEIAIDVELSAVKAEEYDALLLPGGTLNADALRLEPQAIKFVKAFVEARKPIGAICHAPWLLVEADVLDDRKLTSWGSLKTDIRNAGGDWIDREVVVDRNLVTSRKPDDIPAFNRALVETFARRREKRVRIGPPDAS